MTAAEIIKYLKKTPMFAEMDEAALSELARKATLRQLEKDEILFLEGDRAEGLWVVATGAIRAYRIGPGGREQVVHTERAPATVGEIPAFDDGLYPASAAAEERTMLLFLSKDTMRQLFIRYPNVALCALRIMALRLRRAAALIEEIALHDVRQRLARFLIEDLKLHGRSAEKVELVLTNREIAARIGSVREVVSRALRRLEQEGIIQIDHRSISVLDPQALARLARRQSSDDQRR